MNDRRITSTVLQMRLSISDAAGRSTAYILDEFKQSTTGGFQRRCNPGFSSLSEFFFRYIYVDSMRIRIDGNDVSVLHKSDRSSFLSFRSDMTDDEAL